MAETLCRACRYGFRATAACGTTMVSCLVLRSGPLEACDEADAVECSHYEPRDCLQIRVAQDGK